MNKTRLLKKLWCSFFFALFLQVTFAQNKTIRGTVTDDKGAPLAGASVGAKGSAAGTATNASGSFTIGLPASTNQITVSFLGFETQTITIGNNTTVNVHLTPQSANMDAVVVVGYGTQRRRDITGSVSSVKGDVFKDQPITNPVAALQGRIAGVNVVQSSGAPDATPTIVIRGLASFNQPTPLYIVDGVRVPDVNNINVQDIASIDVLKDAASAAIYGSAAAGGVLVITTKKGTGVGTTPVINFSARYGVTKPELVNLLGKDDFIKLQNIVNPSYFAGATQLDTLSNTDWVHTLYRNASEQNYNLSVSGSSPVVNYLFSGFYNAQTGIFIKNYSNIGGARINTDYKLSKAITIGEQLGISQRQTAPLVGSQADLHNAPFRTQPIIPVYDKFGNYGIEPRGYNGLAFSGPNPFGAVQSADAQNTKNNLQANVYADIKLPFHLNFRTTFGYSYYLESQDYLQNAYNFGPVALSTNSLEKFNIQSSQLLSNYVLTYNQSFGRHNLNAVAGYEQISSKYNNIDAIETSIGLPGYSFIQTSASALALNGQYDPNGLIKSEFGRINYNYAGRYYLSGSIRQDANFTEFGPSKQRGVFPAGSVGWNISEEPFFKSALPGINLLKFRASYGSLGNSNIRQYSFVSTYNQFTSTAGISAGGQNFAPGSPLIIANSITGIPNPGVHWETVVESNVGIDGEALHGRLYFTAEYYNKDTKDMLYSLHLATSTGFTQPYISNIGKVNNRGFDVLLGYRDKVGKLNYDVSVNAGFNKNKVVSLSGLATDAFYDAYNYYNVGDPGFNIMSNQNLTITKAGLPFGSFYGYNVQGIFKTDADAASQIVNGHQAHAGDLIYQDLDKNGVIDANDRTVIGNSNPKVVYGVNIHLNYQGFDLGMLFNGVAGVQLFNGVKAYEQYLFADGNTTSKVFNDSYLGSNGLTSQPRLGIVQNGAFSTLR